VNALSESMSVEVARDGTLHRLNLSRGKPVSDMIIQPLDYSFNDNDLNQGTRVTFKPDADIFKSGVDFEYERLSNRMDELAYLNAGLTINLIDERITIDVVSASDSQYKGKIDDIGRKVQTYRHDGGISELVKTLCESKIHLHPEVDIISVNEGRKGVNVEVALRWSKDMYTDSIVGETQTTSSTLIDFTI